MFLVISARFNLFSLPFLPVLGLFCLRASPESPHPFHCWSLLCQLSQPGIITRFTVGPDPRAGPYECATLSRK